ncbi:hypothetical protein [Clostridioides difficile]|nr:hypothetical protein [Clostridioides difficile]
MNFGITTLMGQEITIYPWSPPDIETYGEIDVLTLQHSKICKT